MITVRSNDLWLELERLSKEASNIKAAIAYVSDDSCISFGKGDILVVDASDASISGGRTSANLLKVAYEKGSKLYSCDTLHGKVIVFDHYAYIGSANISVNSKERLDEIGVIADHPNIMAGAIKFIDELIRQSIKIDDSFIKAILKIDVRSRGLPPSTKPRKVKIEKQHTWLVSLCNDIDYPGSKRKVEIDNETIKVSKNEEPAWFWMKKENRLFDEAKVGDSVVKIEREKQKSKKPETAYRHCVIKKITTDDAAKTKAYHYAYTENHAITWSSFEQLAKKAGISRLGSGLNTVRELTDHQSEALFALWATNNTGR